MKVYSTQTQEIFNATLTTNHPSTIPGPLAIQRLNTGEFIALRDILGVQNVPYQLVEVSVQERAKLQEAGITLAETTEDLKNWDQQWNGPKHHTHQPNK